MKRVAEEQKRRELDMMALLGMIPAELLLTMLQQKPLVVLRLLSVSTQMKSAESQFVAALTPDIFANAMHTMMMSVTRDPYYAFYLYHYQDGPIRGFLENLFPVVLDPVEFANDRLRRRYFNGLIYTNSHTLKGSIQNQLVRSRRQLHELSRMNFPSIVTRGEQDVDIIVLNRVYGAIGPVIIVPQFRAMSPEKRSICSELMILDASFFDIDLPEFLDTRRLYLHRLAITWFTDAHAATQMDLMSLRRRFFGGMPDFSDIVIDDLPYLRWFGIGKIPHHMITIVTDALSSGDTYQQMYQMYTFDEALDSLLKNHEVSIRALVAGVALAYKTAVATLVPPPAQPDPYAATRALLAEEMPVGGQLIDPESYRNRLYSLFHGISGHILFDVLMREAHSVATLVAPGEKEALFDRIGSQHPCFACGATTDVQCYDYQHFDAYFCSSEHRVQFHRAMAEPLYVSK